MINQDGIRMAKNGGDWTGLYMTTKELIGKIEKHQRGNNQT